MEHLLGKEWQVMPAGGVTGEAYFAQYGEEKLFLKRNSSPFLAVLSAEGIVPKLLWTKRLENGDVITAQRWVSGRELKSFEMKQELVAQLLGKIHRSKELLEMFKRIGNLPLTPQSILKDIREKLSKSNCTIGVVSDAMNYLNKNMQDVEDKEYVVCHADINHNNWILGEQGDLYLIDWDGAIVADPALDLGLLLYLYIPTKDWEEWLCNYGVTLDDDLCKRMHWYVISQMVYVILWHEGRNEKAEMKDSILYLEKLLHPDTEETN
ncbi:phosphotransferase [Anaerobacillus arseniciselenatis]|uniref:Phosphotransferase n=1 Tax=Anaerobacillus arseniciselenatis TaxID=85682 RepID=A0A1S2LCK1_9BACI|nr:phosphotransferase family protein [Anaerobacillus arseniciselenatis]OIJ09265.1 phosphotransferase [Anaerobacillus arseniciselenatis]